MSEDLDKIRRHFRRETGKLDNWIQQPLRITDFCEEDPAFYERLKELNRMRRENEITRDKWYRLTGELLREHQRGEVDDTDADKTL